MTKSSSLTSLNSKHSGSKDSPMQYSVIAEDEPALPGFGPARKLFAVDKLPVFPKDVTDLHQNLLHGVQASGGKAPFLGSRVINGKVMDKYTWQSYDEVLKRVINIGAGFVKLGLTADANVGLFSINNAEWVIAEHACYVQGLVTVPLYDTLGAEAIDYILNLTETSLVVCTADKVDKLLSLAAKIPSIKHIVLMDGDVSSFQSKANGVNVKLIAFTDLEKLGEENPVPKATISSETVATICFTSGTTGLPKGVVLTHGNVLAFVAGAQFMVDRKLCYNFGQDDCHISYLPLAHIFERIVQATLTYYGARAGFYQGDTLKLLDDTEILKPTIFVSVPRLYNKIYDKVNAGVKQKGGIAAFLFKLAYSSKVSNLASGHNTHWLWDNLVFKNIKAKLGGNVRGLITGAAPISPEVVEFLKVGFCCPVYEGYGQTENTASATVTISIDPSSGHIGVPQPQVMIRLRDVPSMGYSSEDKPYPRGEICVKGASVFQGYYKAPDKTAETLSKDGWLYSGDIGQWDEHGRLKIVDRVKNIFKLAQGEYIAPDKIEVVYGTHELVAQVFVYGDSLQAVLVGVVVPDETPLQEFASRHNITGTFKELCANQELCDIVAKELGKYGRERGLQGFENVKAVYLTPDPFTPENGLLSPTFKFKRHEGKKMYQQQLDEMYAKLSK